MLRINVWITRFTHNARSLPQTKKAWASNNRRITTQRGTWKGRYNIKVPGQCLWQTTACSLGCSETTSNYLNVEEEYKVYIQCTSQTSAYALRSWYKKLGGVDYAGHIKPEANNKHKVMAHIILYACSLTRALYLDLVKSLQTTEFLLSLKGMVARRGRASTIFSDNGSMFIGAAAWSKQVQTDENLNDLLMV